MTAAGNGWLAALLDMFFPPRCAGCARRGLWLCGDCAANLKPVVPPVCRYCGRPTGGVQTCVDCWRRRPSLDGVFSGYFFEDPLRPLIHRFKYRHASDLALTLVSLLPPNLLQGIPRLSVVVPVPLHNRRLKQRGYNQSALLAAALAPGLGMAVREAGLERVKDTPAQIGLSASERWQNVRDAFACRDLSLNGASVLLVDDVCTTGATLDACARVLKRAGARRVVGLTIARAHLPK